jgi:hypothetical protein
MNSLVFFRASFELDPFLQDYRTWMYAHLSSRSITLDPRIFHNFSFSQRNKRTHLLLTIPSGRSTTLSSLLLLLLLFRLSRHSVVVVCSFFGFCGWLSVDGGSLVVGSVVVGCRLLVDGACKIAFTIFEAKLSPCCPMAHNRPHQPELGGSQLRYWGIKSQSFQARHSPCPVPFLG